jgi:hypothetical protein
MGYSLIRYLKNLPLHYYLNGGFTQMRGPTISLFPVDPGISRSDLSRTSGAWIRVRDHESSRCAAC